jgi:hypothetical protein
MPHAPGPESDEKVEADEVGEALTANTDNCFSSSVLAHCGQLGVRPSRERYSKRCPQVRHAYSKRGMDPIVQPERADVHRSGASSSVASPSHPV